ncbi:MAG: ABC transporter substrate-binding protein [Actinomycetota bacterium]
MLRSGRWATTRLALLTAALLIIVGCSDGETTQTTEAPTDDAPSTTTGDEATDTTAGQPDDDEASGEGIVIAVAAEPNDLNPGMVGHNEVNTPGMRNVFEPLIQRNSETGELLPGLATDWRQVDPLTWEFDLREGVVFHDGEAFNAEAAELALNWMHDPDLPESERGQIASVYGGPQLTAEATDEYTLTVTTEEEDPILPSRMFFFMMFSPAGFDDSSQLVDNPVGTGPYEFVEWERGSHIELQAFDDWWGHDSDDALGSVQFESATFLFRDEAPVRMAMTEAGEADIAVNLTSEDCSALNSAGHRCMSVGSSETVYNQMDAYHEESMLTDQRVRGAVAHAIDSDSILEAIFGGEVVPASQMVGSHVIGYAPDLEPYPYDPDRSRTLLEEYQADGGELEPISWWYQQDRFPRVSEYVQAAAAMLEEVGFEVEVAGQEAGVAQSEAWPPDFPPNRIRTHTHGNNIGDLSQTARIYFREPPGNGDIGCWCQDQELFDMVVDGEALVGEERAEHWQDVARHVYDEYLYHYGGYLAFNYGLSDRVEWNPQADHYYLLIQMSPVN